MAEPKTKPTTKDVHEFIDVFANTEQKKQDSYRLMDLMKTVSGSQPLMWGPSIIGFGKYHYKYESGHQGEAPLIGFSPRKTAISLYVYTGWEDHEYLLENLGKFKKGKSCIYINKLSDINLDKLTLVMQETIKYLKSKYEESQN